MKYRFSLLIMASAVFCLSLAGVASADSVVKTLYIDGNEIGSVTADDALSFDHWNYLTIACEGSQWYRYNGFEGILDEFAVYDGILSDPCIAAHYNAGAGGYAAAVLADNPLLWLRFEDATSDNNDIAHNSGSADVNGIYIGDAVYGDVNLVTGYAGNAAAEFYGASDGNGTCISVNDSSGYLSLQDVTIEFWVKTTQASDYPRFFQHNNGHTEERAYGAMFIPDTNGVGLIGGGSTGYLTQTINDGSWHHIVVTFDSLQPEPYETEVMADNPVVYLKFDNLLVVDSSVNHYWAGYGMGAEIQKTVGGIGKSLYLDNTILVGDPCHQDAAAYTWNNWGGTLERQAPPYGGNADEYAFAPNDITFEFWMKSVPELTLDQYAMLFQQVGAWTREPNAPGLGSMDENPNDPNVPVLRIRGGSEWWYPGVETPLDNNWHHIVVTYDEEKGGDPNSMGIELYLDGDLVASTTITDPNGEAKLGPELSHIMIGANNDRGWPYNCYGGYIDEFAIYEGVLNADRVATHYAAWQPRNCADVWERGLGMEGDLDKDCDVDFLDFASFALEWVLCNDPCDTNCVPNW